MKFLTESMRLNLKRLALQRAFWFTLIFLVFALSVGGVLYNKTDVSVVNISFGVHYECAIGEEIFTILAEATSNISFVEVNRYTDINALKEDVRLRQTECGYIINPKIQHAHKGDFEELITIITSPATAAAPVLNEIVTAAVLRVISQPLITERLSRGNDENIENFISAQFERYSQSDIFMRPIFEGENHGANYNRVTDITASRIAHGLIGLSILMIALFYIPVLVDGQHINSALRVCGKTAPYYFSMFFAVFIGMFFSGLSGIFTMKIFLPALLDNSSIIALSAYTAVCAAIAAIAAKRRESIAIVQSLGLLIVIFNVLFGGVLLDLREINPYLGQLQYVFPLFWYINESVLY